MEAAGGLPEGGYSQANGEGYSDQEEAADEDPQPQANASPPVQPAVGAGAATFLILQLPQLGRRARHWRDGAP